MRHAFQNVRKGFSILQSGILSRCLESSVKLPFANHRKTALNEARNGGVSISRTNPVTSKNQFWRLLACLIIFFVLPIGNAKSEENAPVFVASGTAKAVLKSITGKIVSQNEYVFQIEQSADKFRIKEIGISGDDLTDQYNDDYRRLDAKIAFDITDNIRIFAEGQNLTDEPTRQYQGGRTDWLIQQERYGRTFWAGFSARW